MIQAIIESGYDGPIGIIDHWIIKIREKPGDNLAGLDLFWVGPNSGRSRFWYMRRCSLTLAVAFSEPSW